MTTKYENTAINVYQGDTEDYTFTVTNSAGAAVNLSGATITFVVKRHEDSPDSIFSGTITDAQFGSVFASGIVVMRFTAANSALIDRDVLYEIESVLGGVTSTLAWGIASIRKQV